MFKFRPNKIKNERNDLSNRLKEARQISGQEISEIAEKIRIDEKYLSALEEGKYENIPEGIYSRQFFKEYCQYLGIDYQPLLDDFDQERKYYLAFKKDKFFNNRIVEKKYFLSFPKIAKAILIIIIVFFGFFYFFQGLNKLMAAPRLELESPLDNLVTDQNQIEIRGNAEPETQISINGKSILSNQNGVFSEVVSLREGLNTIVVSAEKKYSYKNVIKRQILVKNN